MVDSPDRIGLHCKVIVIIRRTQEPKGKEMRQRSNEQNNRKMSSIPVTMCGRVCAK